LGRLRAAVGDRLQQPTAIAERQAELLEIAVAQFQQDIEIDIVGLECIGILLKIVPAQPAAKIAHTVGPTSPLAIPDWHI
jgi:hypothetical protein